MKESTYSRIVYLLVYVNQRYEIVVGPYDVATVPHRYTANKNRQSPHIISIRMLFALIAFRFGLSFFFELVAYFIYWIPAQDKIQGLYLVSSFSMIRAHFASVLNVVTFVISVSFSLSLSSTLSHSHKIFKMIIWYDSIIFA